MARVLIAEDEEAMLDLFGEVVEALGHTVSRARNGQEALLLAQADAPDLVVSDQMMPVRTGLELLRALRAEQGTADVPFLLISAARPKGLEEADHFLPKPCDLADFEAAVERALKQGRAPRAEPAATPSPAARPAALKEEILNWVAHEMKTPLAAARLNAELLLRQLEARASEDEAARARAVMHQLDRMTRVVGAILDAARLSDGKVVPALQRVDLRALVVELVGRWRVARPELRLLLTGEEAPLEVMVDPNQVSTILDNLLSNAVKHAGTDKPVTVALERTPSAVLVKVCDQGPGIPAADLPRLFDRFYRGNNAGEGHGLGLYIAASLARLQGGTLSARSSLGEGSTFSLRLPLRA